MKEEILKILNDHFLEFDETYEECAKELFELFVKSNPNADWEETIKAANDNDTN